MFKRTAQQAPAARCPVSTAALCFLARLRADQRLTHPGILHRGVSSSLSYLCDKTGFVRVRAEKQNQRPLRVKETKVFFFFGEKQSRAWSKRRAWSARLLTREVPLVQN